VPQPATASSLGDWSSLIIPLTISINGIQLLKIQRGLGN
jgi:hypothetical protein